MPRCRAIASLALTLSASSLILLSAIHPAHAQAGDFALKNGDRVVFYGDSITDQRQYTVFAEDYVVTRFPTRNIHFVHSGWGGDRVGGGGGGPIDLRLDRDVIAYRPSVLTIMLGMNDGSYRAYDQNIFNTFSTGYEHILDKVKQALPGVRITLIQPSPYDDVTRAPGFDGGYNSVLVRYGAYLKDQAAKQPGTMVADLNTTVVAMLQKANTTDAANAQKIIPDRVHPGPGGHLIMAGALLKAWNAPALVSSVSLSTTNNGPVRQQSAMNAKVSGLAAKADGSISWTQTDDALPFPLDLKDPVFQLALNSSDFVQTLDQQMLTAKGLPANRYTLRIDDEEVGAFSKEQLDAGVNLASLSTPMMKQAQQVHDLTRRHTDLHNMRWRQVQVPLTGKDMPTPPNLQRTLDAMDALEEDIVKQQRAAAQPKPHRFTLVPQQ